MTKSIKAFKVQELKLSLLLHMNSFLNVVELVWSLEGVSWSQGKGQTWVRLGLQLLAASGVPVCIAWGCFKANATCSAEGAGASLCHCSCSPELGEGQAFPAT